MKRWNEMKEFLGIVPDRQKSLKRHSNLTQIRTWHSNDITHSKNLHQIWKYAIWLKHLIYPDKVPVAKKMVENARLEVYVSTPNRRTLKAKIRITYRKIYTETASDNKQRNGDKVHISQRKHFEKSLKLKVSQKILLDIGLSQRNRRKEA